MDTNTCGSVALAAFFSSLFRFTVSQTRLITFGM